MKRDELRLECLKLACGQSREFTEVMSRAKKFEEHILEGLDEESNVNELTGKPASPRARNQMTGGKTPAQPRP